MTPLPHPAFPCYQDVTLSLCARLSHFSGVQLRGTPWTVAHQTPLPWDSPGKNPGVGCRFLLWGIFPTQGSNLHVSYVSCVGRWIPYH